MFYFVIQTIVYDETLGKLAEQDQTSISGRERSNKHCCTQQVPATQQTNHGLTVLWRVQCAAIPRCKTELESYDSERQTAWLPSEGHEKIRAAVGMKVSKSIKGVGSSAGPPI